MDVEDKQGFKLHRKFRAAIASEGDITVDSVIKALAFSLAASITANADTKETQDALAEYAVKRLAAAISAFRQSRG